MERVNSFCMQEIIGAPMSDGEEYCMPRVEAAIGQTCLVGWQFAADSKWDEAEHFSFEHSRPQEVKIFQDWLNKQTSRNIAFEALFELTNKECCYFGVRIKHLECDKQFEVVRKLLLTCDKGDSLGGVVQSIRDSLENHQIAKAVPEYIELGVFDLWNRVKPLVVWDKDKRLELGTTLVMPAEIQGRAKEPDNGFPALYEPQTKPIMLEAAWGRGSESSYREQCWLSLPIGEYGRVPSKYTLSENRYLAVAATFVPSCVCGC